MKFLSILLPIATMIQLSFVSGFQIPTPNNVGSTKPLPNFDPLGLSVNKDVKKLQEMEIKHGRVAMLASLGLLVQQNFHPLLENANPLAIYQYQDFVKEHPVFTPFLLSVIGIIEGYGIQKAWEYPSKEFPAKLRDDYTPGSLINLEVSDNVRNQEINHGRLAMIVTFIFTLTELLHKQ